MSEGAEKPRLEVKSGGIWPIEATEAAGSGLSADTLIGGFLEMPAEKPDKRKSNPEESEAADLASELSLIHLKWPFGLGSASPTPVPTST